VKRCPTREASVDIVHTPIAPSALLRRSVPAVAIAIIVTWCGPVTSAQGPRREQPIRVPGTDVVLGDGWTVVLTNGAEYRCMYAVPTSWAVSPRGERAIDREGEVRVDLSTLDDAQWIAHRSAVRAAMPPAALRQDTSRRFRIEQLSGTRVWEHIEESDGIHVCAVDIETTRANQDLVLKIASTVHVAHANNLSWMGKP
jgi:hypothetical protein